MNQIIDYVLANLAALTSIQQGLFAALALICQLAGAPAASKVFGTFTTVDLGRIARYLRGILEARKVVTSIGQTSLVLVASLGLASQGCSLEAARQARINSAVKANASGAPVAARPAAECKALDDVHVYTMYGAEISLGVGTAAGVLAAADTSSTVENAAIGTGIGAAAVAAGLAYWSQKSGAIWTETCSQ